MNPPSAFESPGAANGPTAGMLNAVLPPSVVPAYVPQDAAASQELNPDLSAILAPGNNFLNPEGGLRGADNIFNTFPAVGY